MKAIIGFIFSIAFILPEYSLCQENLGIAYDRFVPVQGMKLNPSAIADQTPWLSIQLMGFGAYARNNFVFIERSKPQWSNAETVASYNYKGKNLRVHVDTEIEGPSFSFTVHQHAFGLHTAVRSYSSVRNVPEQLGEIISDESFDDIAKGFYNVNNFKARSLSWGEIGVTYANVFNQNGNEIWTSGVSINKLYGIHSAGINIDQAQLEVRDTLDYGILTSLDGNYHWAEPAFKSGKGWSTNLGLTYKKLEQEAENHVPHSPKGNCIIPEYIYKVGVSIIDLGSLKFDQASESASFSEQITTEDFEDIVNEEMSDALILNKQVEFKSSTPAALHIFIDHKLGHNFYANGSITKGLGFISKNGPTRTDVIHAGVRYSSQWLGLGMPITFVDNRNLQLGISLRLGPIILGSDHVIPFIAKSDIYATDIYASLHIPFLNNPSCADKGKQRKRSAKVKSGYPPCPKW